MPETHNGGFGGQGNQEKRTTQRRYAETIGGIQRDADADIRNRNCL